MEKRICMTKEEALAVPGAREDSDGDIKFFNDNNEVTFIYYEDMIDDLAGKEINFGESDPNIASIEKWMIPRVATKPIEKPSTRFAAKEVASTQLGIVEEVPETKPTPHNKPTRINASQFGIVEEVPLIKPTFIKAKHSDGTELKPDMPEDLSLRKLTMLPNRKYHFEGWFAKKFLGYDTLYKLEHVWDKLEEQHLDESDETTWLTEQGYGDPRVKEKEESKAVIYKDINVAICIDEYNNYMVFEIDTVEKDKEFHKYCVEYKPIYILRTKIQRRDQ